MKDARINLARTIIEEFSPQRSKKRELDKLERGIYDAALRISAKALMTPAEARAAIAAHDQELSAQVARAEAARLSRETRKQEGPVLGIVPQ